MTKTHDANERLSGRQSLRLGLGLLVIMLCVAFFGEMAIMLALLRFLPKGTNESTQILLDASLLAVLLTAVMLPLMLNFRRRNLRVARRALRLQYTLDQHSIISIADSSGRITFTNDRFCEISGYTRQELLGQNHRILKSGIHPPELFEDLWRTIARGGTWHGDICNRKKDGGHYWVRATITPFMDESGKAEEYIAIRTEITAQKMLENASRKQELRVRTILDNLGEGVYTLDARGKLTYMNAEAERLLGWRFEELAGKGLHDIIHHHRPDGEVLPAAECAIHQAMRENRVFRSSEELFFHRDGTLLPVKITGAPLTLEDDRLGSVAVFSDMREEQQLNKRLLEARDAAEGAARLKAEFLSTMSHEIRTPLNGVIGMTDLLLDTPLDNEQTEFARTIKTSADALMSIINDILDFSKIEAGRLVLEHTDFSLRQTIEDCLDVVASRAHEKGLTLAGFIAPELPDHLLGDPTRIRQILLNFLSNAIKFTARGDVVASAVFEADASARPRCVVVRLAVRDCGIGLSAEAIAGLFQPFSQADSSTTRKYGGTGLGLSICKRLAVAMGGEIGVDSTPGAGSTFWARIPLEVADEKREDMPPDQALSGKRMLVAGDDTGSRAIWCSYLEAWHVHCDVVTSLAELRQRLNELERNGRSPDALLLVEPVADATLIEAVATFRTKEIRSTVCCLARPDRELKTALAAQGVQVVQPPLKQSALYAVLMALAGKAPGVSGRRLSDTADRAETNQRIASGHTLLLAEDNPVNQRVAVHMLNKLGYAVDVVDNGALAVAAVASGNYSLVLMDCQMPEMDGFAATAAIRRAELRSSRLPIVAMTANALQGDREQCLAAGMDDYIAKPIDVPRLSALLATWLPENLPVAASQVAVPPAPTPATDRAAIDMTRLTELFGDDDAVIDELLEVFEQSLPPMRERLRREVQAGGGDLKAIAHDLRGAAANIGALPLAEYARQFEALAAGSNRDEMESLAALIESEFVRINRFVRQRTESQKL